MGSEESLGRHRDTGCLEQVFWKSVLSSRVNLHCGESTLFWDP